MVFSKGTHYADTSVAVADALAVLSNAKVRYEQAQQALALQNKHRIEECKRTEATLHSRQRVDIELQSPNRIAVNHTIATLADDIVSIHASVAQMERTVQLASECRDKKLECVAALQATLEKFRRERQMCVETLDKETRSSQASLAEVVLQLQHVERDERVLEEENVFLRAQVAVQRSKLSQNSASSGGGGGAGHSRGNDAATPTASAVTSNGYSFVPS